MKKYLKRQIPEKNPRFIYLVQTASSLPANYSCLDKNNSDVVYITWRDRVNESTFFPNTTWTQGRNQLIELAKEKGGDYLYYIFLDDDLTINKEKVDLFERMLMKYLPAIAAPRMWGHNQSCEDLQEETHTVYAFDAAMNAFHSSVVFDNILFPYIDNFDDESWWYSQLILLHLANVFYDGYILQFNNVHVLNEGHQDYPRSNDFQKIESWMMKELLADLIVLLRHPDDTKNVKVRLPVAPLNSYKISLTNKQKFLKKYE